jgi:hypothetical protein
MKKNKQLTIISRIYHDGKVTTVTESDGTHGINIPITGTVTIENETFEIGITHLDYDHKENRLTIYARKDK